MVNNNDPPPPGCVLALLGLLALVGLGYLIDYGGGRDEARTGVVLSKQYSPPHSGWGTDTNGDVSWVRFPEKWLLMVDAAGEPAPVEVKKLQWGSLKEGDKVRVVRRRGAMGGEYKWRLE